jgi:DNA-binding MarR family transcriptional regulator
MIKKKKKNGRPSAVSYDDFVKLWKTTGSVGEVAKKLGIKPNSASAIANRLRKGGVKLRKFARRAPQPVDIKRLNKISETR